MNIQELDTKTKIDINGGCDDVCKPVGTFVGYVIGMSLAIIVETVELAKDILRS
jgi:hypothetical protein